jgi:hypothetical protein
MKRKCFFGLLILFGFVSFNCFGQSANEQRLVGTWIRESEAAEDTVVFNADGTFSQTQSIRLGDAVPYKYGAAANKIGIVYTAYNKKQTYFGDYYISTDGKTLIIRTPDSSTPNLEGLYRKKT